MCLTSGPLKCSNSSHRRSLLYCSVRGLEIVKKKKGNDFLILLLSLLPLLLPPSWQHEGGRWHKHGMTEHSWRWKGTVRTSGPTTEMTHAHTWLCAHTQTDTLTCHLRNTRADTHSQATCPCRLHSLRDEFTKIKKRERWKNTNKKGNRTQEQQHGWDRFRRPAREREWWNTTKWEQMSVKKNWKDLKEEFAQNSSFTRPHVVF